MPFKLVQTFGRNHGPTLTLPKQEDLARFVRSSNYPKKLENVIIVVVQAPQANSKSPRWDITLGGSHTGPRKWRHGQLVPEGCCNLQAFFWNDHSTQNLAKNIRENVSSSTYQECEAKLCFIRGCHRDMLDTCQIIIFKLPRLVIIIEFWCCYKEKYITFFWYLCMIRYLHNR